MEDQVKKRKRKLIKKSKGPELVRSVKAGMASTVVATAMTSTALLHFQDLWK